MILFSASSPSQHLSYFGSDLPVISFSSQMTCILASVYSMKFSMTSLYLLADSSEFFQVLMILVNFTYCLICTLLSYLHIFGRFLQYRN
ncbi:uncharacterized protein C8R40DRAFT_1090641 [Lentinula edodes]|uniref:uncharacterized protein n=1 Tax=Lentinula edodes TaxID=5353 RepID=UPI001E8EE4C7|nr:uncharacterized protein C8R40DRAFT_1090641 [Lentinula edodes]KAH7878673.1 hypothetical protein C8R40DRAFT_1090641 [Lentinula edodes]